ncbi:MAG TPA: nuclear transport factor 2 family protein [Micromonosporaceae bacterium]|jgi:hypothetical protein
MGEMVDSHESGTNPDETANTRRVVREYVDSLEQRDWSRVSGLVDDHIVYEMPQSRERIRGKARFLQFNQEYPGDWHLRIRYVVADGHHAAALIDARVGDEHQDACAWFAMSDAGLINAITDYWPEPYEPHAERAHLVERY